MVCFCRLSGSFTTDEVLWLCQEVGCPVILKGSGTQRSLYITNILRKFIQEQTHGDIPSALKDRTLYNVSARYKPKTPKIKDVCASADKHDVAATTASIGGASARKGSGDDDKPQAEEEDVCALADKYDTTAATSSGIGAAAGQGSDHDDVGGDDDQGIKHLEQRERTNLRQCRHSDNTTALTVCVQ